MQQQQQRMSNTGDIHRSAQESVIREYRSLVERYPGELDGERRADFESELGRLIPKGIYRDASGEDVVLVERVMLLPRFDRAIDAHVEYVVVRGKLGSGRLPLLFFIEMHRFVRADAASL